MDTAERKRKIEQKVWDVLAHVRADLAHMESNLRLMRRATSDNNVDWFASNIAKSAMIGGASLQVLLRQLDEEGLTTAEHATAVEERGEVESVTHAVAQHVVDGGDPRFDAPPEDILG